MTQRHVLTPQALDRFIAELARGFTVRHAAGVIGFDPSSLYARRKVDPDFAKRWDDAEQAGADLLLDTMLQRAVHGTKKGIYYQGLRCAEEVQFSDSLLYQLARVKFPKMFKERVEVDDGATQYLIERIAEARKRLRATGFAMPGEDAPTAPTPIDPDDPVLQ